MTPTTKPNSVIWSASLPNLPEFSQVIEETVAVVAEEPHQSSAPPVMKALDKR